MRTRVNKVMTEIERMPTSPISGPWPTSLFPFPRHPTTCYKIPDEVAWPLRWRTRSARRCRTPEAPSRSPPPARRWPWTPPRGRAARCRWRSSRRGPSAWRGRARSPRPQRRTDRRWPDVPCPPYRSVWTSSASRRRCTSRRWKRISRKSSSRWRSPTSTATVYTWPRSDSRRRLEIRANRCNEVRRVFWWGRRWGNGCNWHLGSGKV